MMPTKCQFARKWALLGGRIDTPWFGCRSTSTHHIVSWCETHGREESTSCRKHFALGITSQRIVGHPIDHQCRHPDSEFTPPSCVIPTVEETAEDVFTSTPVEVS